MSLGAGYEILFNGDFVVYNMTTAPKYLEGVPQKIDSENKDASGAPAWTYTVLSTPSFKNYKFLTLHKMPDDFTGSKDGYEYFHGYISANELQSKKLPLDANPRKPSPTPVTKSMQATLSKFGDEFHHWNNGITVICESVKDNGDGTYKIEFGTPLNQHGYGIVNGGHTYYSIEQSKIKFASSVAARIELVILPDRYSDLERENAIKQIAMKRNAHNELDVKTETHYSGGYNPWIEALGAHSKEIVWLQGDPNAVAGAIGAEKFITLLTSSDPYYFTHFQTKAKNHHQQCAAGSSPHKRWAKELAKPFSDLKMEHSLLVLDDLMKLLHQLSYSLENDDFSKISKNIKGTKIWQQLKSIQTKDLKFHPDRSATKKFSGYDLFTHARWGPLFLGPFRGNMWIGRANSTRFTGWLTDPMDLWSKERISFVKHLHTLAQSISGSWVTKFFQDGSPFSYDFAERQLGKANLIKTMPYKFFEEGVSEAYHLTSAPSKATHTLEIINTVEGRFSKVVLHKGVITTPNQQAFYERR